MAEKQNPDERAYDWLHRSRDQSPEPDDADETQVIGRTAGHDLDEDQVTDRLTATEPATPPPSSSPEAPEPTQILEAQPRPPAPTAPQPTSGRSSFGGTFPAPPSQGATSQGSASQGPRFATPAQTYAGSSQPPRPPQGSTSPAPPKPPRRKRRNWWVRGIVLLVIAWLVFLVVVPVWTWQHISKVNADPGGQRPTDTPGTTYLLVGSDSRVGLSKQQRADLGTGAGAGQRTDTIILLHVPDSGGPTLVLSIPRDSYVDIPGHGKAKINAAYAFDGPQLLVHTVEQATGVRVDDYVQVGFTGFVDIVDAVGGIQVCPTQSINDPKAGHLKMSKGCQDVNGHIALDYTRSRAFRLGDITRTQHQREVITAVGKKAASWQTLVLPWRYLAVNRAAADTLQVGQNVGPIDLARFAWAMAHSGGSNAKRCVVPYSSLGASTSAGSAVLWDEQKAKVLFQAIRADDTASITCTATGQ